MAKEPRSLAGKVVAITGGARGIGEVTARSLVREGAKVAIGDLDLELAEKTASSLGGDTIALELDVTRRDSFASYLSQVEERLGPVDVLINNAGIMPLGRFVDEDDATARRMFDINVHGLMFGMKLVMPSMMRRNTGHIVNIASQAGKGGFPGGATYCATKHAVVGLSEAVRGELLDTDIDVSVRDAGRGQHRARLRPGRHARRQEARAAGGRRRDRRRAQVPEVRRLGAEVLERDLPLHAAPAALAAARRSCARSRPIRSWRAPT